MNTAATGILFSLGVHVIVFMSLAWLPIRPTSLDSAVEHPAYLTVGLVAAAVTPPISDGVEAPVSPSVPIVTEAPEQPEILPPPPEDVESVDVAKTADNKHEADLIEADPSEAASTTVAGGAAPAVPVEFGRAPLKHTEPVPIDSLVPEYPVMARRMGLEGTVVLILTIDENGRAIDHRIIEPRAPQLLEDAAIEVAMSASYQPGTLDAMPVSDTLRLRIVFRLET